MSGSCHLTLPGKISPASPLPSTLDVRLEPLALAFLRKLEASGGRLFIETSDDGWQAHDCLLQGLGSPAPDDLRCFSISPKGRAYLARLRGAD